MAGMGSKKDLIATTARLIEEAQHQLNRLRELREQRRASLNARAESRGPVEMVVLPRTMLKARSRLVAREIREQ
jgi:hypothetical protein